MQTTRRESKKEEVKSKNTEQHHALAAKKSEPRDIDERSFAFAVRVIRMVNVLPRTIAAIEIGKQIVRSAMSVNSNIVQARGGVSRADFRNHMRIALKEAKETLRWTEMLIASDLLSEANGSNLVRENREIIAVLTAIIRRVM